ncbi:MAG TPA: protein kinase [Pyrinomonadaceae bacterium]|nr:protein kinase [Pyrinomonadaceae bacterium]
MNPEQWRKINELFDAALNRPVDERAAFLDFACPDDPEVRERVAAMLAADAREDLLMDRPAYQAVGTMSAPWQSPDDSHSFSGEMIGDYRLIRELGRGGMGTVYLAYDTRLGRPAALKLLPTRLVSPERVRRLEREARAASALNHPHIITIYDFGRENGRDFIASEFVAGRRLRDYVGTSELTLNQIVEVGIQVASALETAHAAGIIHRDIKPENIMLRPDGYAKVLDFGLAKLTEAEFSDASDSADPGKTPAFETRTGVLLGTVHYMSPEQVRGQKLDGRSDLFSLGVVLYELLTGERPFQGETPHHTMVAIEDSEALPLAYHLRGIPPRLQDIISRVLAKNRDQRYQTARDFLTDLEALQAELAPNAPVEMIGDGGAGATRIGQHTTPLMPEPVARITATPSKYTAPAAVKLFGRAKRHKLFVIATAILIAAGAYFYFGRGFSWRQPAITDKDTILLADFNNTTGDTDFDGTLKQGLTVQLGQSPYLNIFPEDRARDTLRLMERPHDAKITREVGREICQRRGIKVLMVSSIASLGRNYVITLEAVNSQSGDTVAQQQTEAEGKEQVLQALGSAATEIRKKLGESLSSIQKFNVPIEQATTASLAAFKDFTLGIEFRRQGKYAESVPPFKRAVELDGEFALAHLQLGTSYRDLRNLALGNKYLERAYELRERVSERERLEISATYFRHITGELDKRIAMTSLMTQTYPQDPYVYHLHGNSLMIAGEFDQAAEAYRTALRLDADYGLPRSNLALALIGLERFDEAQEIIKQGLDRGLDPNNFYKRLYLIAFLKGDSQALEHQAELFTGKADEYQSRELQARAFAFAGRRREASRSFAQAAALAEARGLPAEKARILSDEINLSATFGLTQSAGKQVAEILALLEKEHISFEELQPSLIGQLDSQPLAWTLALCGDTSRAQSLAEDFTRKFPQDTIHNSVWVPLIRATLELKRGPLTSGPAGVPDRAVPMLPPSRQYEAALNFRPTWVRGLAYLQAKDGALAAAEFQRIIDHRGWDVLSPLWPLAHLGLARAAVLQGDAAKGRQAYEDFFQLWKDADADLPVLLEARAEYKKLK